MKKGTREEWEVAWKIAQCLPSLRILGTEVAMVDRAHPSLPLGSRSSAGAEPLRPPGGATLRPRGPPPPSAWQ